MCYTLQIILILKLHNGLHIRIQSFRSFIIMDTVLYIIFAYNTLLLQYYKRTFTHNKHLYTFVRVHVCVYVCVCLSLRRCVIICVDINVRVCAYVCVSVRVYARANTALTLFCLFSSF